MQLKIEEQDITQARLLISKRRITIKVPKYLPETYRKSLTGILTEIGTLYSKRFPIPLKASYKPGEPYLFIRSIRNKDTVGIEHMFDYTPTLELKDINNTL